MESDLITVNVASLGLPLYCRLAGESKQKRRLRENHGFTAPKTMVTAERLCGT